MFKRLPCQIVAAVVGICCLSGLHASRAAESGPLEAALAKPVEFEFRETPLDDVISFLSRASDAPIVADQRALQKSGVKLDKVLITSRLSGAPLKIALSKILSPQKLDWIIRHDALIVTTAKAAAEKYYDTRVYKITRRVPVDRRMRSIMHNIDPESWATAGGTGDAAPLPPKLLLVYQSPQRHRQIERKFARSVVRVRDRRPQVFRRGSIEETLEAPAAFNFADVPLVDVLKQLGEQYDVKIVVDHQACNAAGIRFEHFKVGLQVGEVRHFAGGLSLLLETVHPALAWTADGGRLLTITTSESAGNKMIPQDYNVSGIAPDDDSKLLIEAIEYTVAPSSWEFAGGDGTIEAGKAAATLHVVQSRLVHRQLRRLFADLRAGRDEEKK